METEKRKERHRKWQNAKYANNPKFREDKKRRAKEWRIKHIERYKKYHEAYRKKMRAKTLAGEKK